MLWKRRRATWCIPGVDGDRGGVDFVAGFADAVVDGGDYECVSKTLKEDMASGRAFGQKMILMRWKLTGGQESDGPLWMLGLFVRRRQYIWRMHSRAWALRKHGPAPHVIGCRWRRGVEWRDCFSVDGF